MTKKSILLVDDDRDILMLYQITLRKEGYSVKIAPNGNQAIKKAKKAKFDLAILDFVLPDMRGDNLAFKLREIDNTINFIFITGYAYFRECIESLNIGISEILLKPLKFSELINATKKALHV